jgi:hypothetical protein
VALFLTAPAEPSPFARDNLVAWCVVPFDAKKRSPEDRAAMLKRLGFKRFAYDWRSEHLPTFERELAALKKEGIELTAVWFPGGSNQDGQFLLDTLRKHQVRTQLWVMITDPAPGQDHDAKVKAAAGQIAPLARAVLKDGHKIGLYNHGGWGGEPENQLAVLGAVNLPNVGLVYNLHHGHDHLDRFPELLAKMKPRLYCLNLNGMVKQGDRHGQKIIPLGQGDLDLGLLKTIRDSGYTGPIGIIGHTQDDAEERLRDNLDGLDWLLPQLDGKSAGPRLKPRTQKLVPTLRLTADGAIEAIGLPATGRPTAIRVTVVGQKDPIPGETRPGGDTLRFIPRFPLTPGVTYRAEVPGLAITADLSVPKPKREPTTVITQVHPTAERLPENTLRMYVHFSRPMSRGDVYRHVRLLREDGTAVADPFLELDEQLWSQDGMRFTLLFDPGRVKRGLKPREEAGPILEEGKKYTFVIDRSWEDENGTPLKASYRKSFAVGPPDDMPVDPEKWKLTPPVNGGRPIPQLRVRFEKPLDRALAGRMIWVVGPDGKRLEGEAHVVDQADSWSFRTVRDAWPPGEYKLVIDTRLEDVCGNRVGEPFEIDVFKPVQKRIEGKTVERRFVVR